MEQKSLYDSLLAFQALFENAGFDYPADAASYYVLYTAAFNEITTFAALLDKAKTLSRNASRKSLENGRRELLQRGLIARVLFTHDEEAQEEFGREAYVAADPFLIWEDLGSGLTTRAGEELLQSMRRSAEQLSSTYQTLFGEYGLAIEEGKLTFYYSGVWLHYTILALCRKAPRQVSLWPGGVGSIIRPSVGRFRRILETGSSIRVIFDRTQDTESAMKLQEQAKGKLEIRFTRLNTTRRMALVGDDLALDALRILPLDMPAPGYMGTAYLDKESISELQTVFEDNWNVQTEAF